MGSFPSSHMVTYNHLTTVPGDSTPSSDFRDSRHICGKQTHKIKYDHSFTFTQILWTHIIITYVLSWVKCLIKCNIQLCSDRASESKVKTCSVCITDCYVCYVFSLFSPFVFWCFSCFYVYWYWYDVMAFFFMLLHHSSPSSFWGQCFQTGHLDYAVSYVT